MSFGIIQRILGVLLMFFSITLLPPMGVSLFYHDGSLAPFIDAFAVIFAAGFIAWLPARRHHRDLRVRDGFLVVSLTWVLIGLFGALPLWFAHNPQMSFTDAAFESVSGLTTTGSTVIIGLDSLPRSILYYRQQIQWFGGMGIIVLALAILPMLGVGGMQLYRAETPGPVKDKITPRVTETAKALWLVYFGITFACAMSFWAAGMPLFDAIGNSFAAVATGGYSMHDASFAYYHSPLIELIAAFFMFISGVNFSVHFLAFRSGSARTYFRDPEFRTYASVFVAMITLITFYLYAQGTYPTLWQSFVKTTFQVASMSTSTGFTSAGFDQWPGFVPVLLILIGFMGACAGSTTGGMKVIRFHLIFKQGFREVMRLIHPNAQIPVKMGKAAVSDRVVEAVWGFFAVYVGTFSFLFLLLLAAGMDQVSAFSGLATCMNGVGPGLGKVAANFKDISDAAKWVLMAGMLLGRLEIFTILVLFTPAFWRR